MLSGCVKLIDYLTYATVRSYRFPSAELFFLILIIYIGSFEP